MFEFMGLFWNLAMLLAVLICVYSAERSGFWLFIGSLAILCLFVPMGDRIDLESLIVNHWPRLVAIFVGYLVIGSVWALFRWRLLLPELLKELKLSLSVHPGMIPPGRDKADLFDRWVYAADRRTIIPNVGYHVDKLARWVTAWPLSVLAWLLTDFLIETGRMIVSGMTGILNQISLSVFRGEAGRDFSQSQVGDS